MMAGSSGSIMRSYVLPVAGSATFIGLAPSLLRSTGLDPFDTYVVAIALLLHFLLLISSPQPPSWLNRSFLATLGLWGVHLFYSGYLALYKREIPEGWKPLFNSGMVHVLVLVSAIIDYAFTWRVLPMGVLLCMSLVHASFISAILLFCCEAAHKALLPFLSAACLPHMCIVLLPPLIVRHASPAPRPAAASRSCKLSDPSDTWQPSGLKSAADVKCTSADTSSELGADTGNQAHMPASAGAGSSSSQELPAALNTPLSVLSTHDSALRGPITLEPELGRDGQNAHDLMHAYQYRSLAYRSCLGRKLQVSIKLRSGTQLADLPPNIGSVLRSALNNTCAPLQVLSVGVRPGCIMLNLDVVQPWQEEAGQPGGPVDEQVAEQLTRKVLSLLEGLLHDGPASAADPATRPSGVYMRVQVGSIMMSVEWCADTQAWCIQPLSLDVLDPLPAPGQLSLGLVAFLGSQAFSCADNTAVPPSHQHHHHHHYSPAPRQQQQQQPSFTTVVHEFRLQAQLWGCESSSSGGMAMLDEPMCVAGWVPPAPGEHVTSWPWPIDQAARPQQGECCSSSSVTGSTSASEGIVRLLARCGGGYLMTRVEASSGPPAGQLPGTALYQVVVEVPDDLLVRHHESGAASCLLPLHLELWQDEVLLSSSTLLHLPTSGSQPWWWGAPAALMQGAVRELDVLDWTAHEHSTDQERLNSYLDFTRDLTIWLEEVRALAAQAGMCSAAAVAQVSTHLRFSEHTATVLTDAERLQLQELLVDHTKALGFTHLPQLIAHQYQTVVQPAVRRRQLGACGRLAQLAYTLVSGRSCQLCEQHYKASLSSSMLLSQVVPSSAMLVTAGLLMVTSLAYDHATVYIAFNIPWVALHVAGLLQGMRFKGAGQPAALSNTWLVYSWCWRVMVQAAYAMRLLPVPHFVAHQFTNFTWLLNCAVLGMCEQMQASALLQPRVTLILGLLVEVPSVAMLALVNNKQQDAWFVLVATPVMVVGSRLLLDLHMRRRLTQAHNHKHVEEHTHATQRNKRD